jgi:protein subunit release factor A
MYQKFAALRGWRFEIMHLALTETGGCKHGSAAISGRRCSWLLAGSLHEARGLSRDCHTVTAR